MGNKDSKTERVFTHEEILVTNETTGYTGVYIDKKNIPSFKIVLIGDPNVGKTAIFERYIRNRFRSDYRPTRKVILENVVKTVNLPSKAVNSVVLWDIPGSEDMDLRASYFRNVDAAIVVVDMNDEDSIELAGAWKQDFINKASNAKLVVDKLPNGIKVTRLEQLPCNPAKIPVMLLGNKYDLVEEKLNEERLQNALNGVDDTKTEEQTMENNFKKMKKQLDKKDGDSADSDDGENKDSDSDRPFPAQRGPKSTDAKPECVKLLDEVKEEHDFLGSVMISAKDADGSADAAIQSLIRYLLEQHYGKRKPKEKPPPAAIIEADEEDYRPLLDVGNEDFDKLFKRCYNPMQRSGDYCSYHELVLKHFKQCCADNGFLTHGKPSLEDCILGIREHLQVLGKMDLKVVECDHFVNLTYNVDPRVKVPKEINIALNVFNTEYAVVCNSVLRDCPIVLDILEKLDSKIAEKSARISEILAGKNEKVISRAVGVCEQNRARIAFAKTQVRNCIKEVGNAKTKVSAAIMW